MEGKFVIFLIFLFFLTAYAITHYVLVFLFGKRFYVIDENGKRRYFWIKNSKA